MDPNSFVEELDPAVFLNADADPDLALQHCSYFLLIHSPASFIRSFIRIVASSLLLDCICSCSVPQACRGDRAAPGLQFGVGVNFLWGSADYGSAGVVSEWVTPEHAHDLVDVLSKRKIQSWIYKDRGSYIFFFLFLVITGTQLRLYNFWKKFM